MFSCPCKNCQAQILWVTLEEGPQKGKRVPVDARPVFVLERPLGEKSLRTFYTAEGEFFRGVQLKEPVLDDEMLEAAEVVFTPHRCEK